MKLREERTEFDNDFQLEKSYMMVNAFNFFLAIGLASEVKIAGTLYSHSNLSNMNRDR